LPLLFVFLVGGRRNVLRRVIAASELDAFYARRNAAKRVRDLACMPKSKIGGWCFFVLLCYFCV